MNQFLKVTIKTISLLLGTTFSFGYDDLSYLKNTSLTPTWSCLSIQQCKFFAATNALDSNKSTCARAGMIGHFTPDKEVTWYVDLGVIYSVYSISIQFKDYGPAYGIFYAPKYSLTYLKRKF
ncbi:uncharacterized protein LOC134259428 [Saccostrea cucullata]|uniref:uncharacterized protein LOC134259428 n=1 Tax=Saccostrea cuccullata TaxID=36930 RepID=UPI002ED57C90